MADTTVTITNCSETFSLHPSYENKNWWESVASNVDLASATKPQMGCRTAEEAVSDKRFSDSAICVDSYKPLGRFHCVDSNGQRRLLPPPGFAPHHRSPIGEVSKALTTSPVREVLTFKAPETCASSFGSLEDDTQVTSITSTVSVGQGKPISATEWECFLKIHKHFETRSSYDRAQKREGAAIQDCELFIEGNTSHF
ncbi:Uu.00g042270.m01.CDS01 [Anthostomella pinea]|uniref:Uu.00g042270.m01.CDS01 n=1 Tax=Anthostomella pinea TaxID=933095 RepID=A0AAI8YBP9_9PEZI|nr:Uu.00g042270.m01.CDS01 [Anthostomella pinea]